MDAQTNAPPVSAGTGPLTLEAAAGLMGGDDEETKRRARRPEVMRDAADDARHSRDDTDMPEAAADGLSGDDRDTESGEPDLPAIEPPASWKAADKDLFRNLPRDVQKAISERERMREQATNRAMQEAAETRKAAEAAYAAVESERQRYAQQLAALLPALHQQVASEFPDIRTPADAVALAQNDPARYARWRAKLDAVQYAQAEAQRVSAQAQEQQSAQLRAYVHSEASALIQKRPELRDAAVRERLTKELRDYAVELGYRPEQFDSNFSHLNLLVLEKAMLYDRAQRARDQAIQRPVPKVQRPGTAESRADRASEARAAKLKRLEKTGRVEDAIGLLRL